MPSTIKILPSLLLLSSTLGLSGCLEIIDEAVHSSDCDTELSNRMLHKVNQYRASGRYCGARYMPAVASLHWNDFLQQAATVHSRDMAQHNFFSHRGSDGSSVRQRVANTGAPYTYVGENIYGGRKTIDSVLQGWLASPGHCENIMSAQYSSMGAACIKDSGSNYTYYWTQVFARD